MPGHFILLALLASIQPSSLLHSLLLPRHGFHSTGLGAPKAGVEASPPLSPEPHPGQLRVVSGQGWRQGARRLRAVSGQGEGQHPVRFRHPRQACGTPHNDVSRAGQSAPGTRLSRWKQTVSFFQHFPPSTLAPQPRIPRPSFTLSDRTRRLARGDPRALSARLSWSAGAAPTPARSLSRLLSANLPASAAFRDWG